MPERLFCQNASWYAGASVKGNKFNHVVKKKRTIAALLTAALVLLGSCSNNSNSGTVENQNSVNQATNSPSQNGAPSGTSTTNQPPDTNQTENLANIEPFIVVDQFGYLPG